jgi:ATP-dependent DNA helicase RecQ
MNSLDILKKYWGYTSFREKQEEIIGAVLEGKDTLALLPTGGGKSVCFQVPAIQMEGICLVISPLVALMQDQVDNLQKKGIKAMAVTSGMSKREIDIALDNAAYGNFKFLYVSPERIETALFKERVKKMNINLIAVDEAHCISQWGYDFRPAYLKIVQLRELIAPNIPFLALTATATPEVVKDIQDKLGFKQQHLIQKSFHRSNLAYVVLQEDDQMKAMLRIMKGVKGSGVVYVNTRKKTKEIAAYLNAHQIQSDFYHAGLDHETRKQKQHNWIDNHCRVIVATNAFGMGIDKPDVRFVIHLDLPETLEAYFQEAGRGGRDEKKAYAVLINRPSLDRELKQRVEREFPPLETIKKAYVALCNYLQIPLNGGLDQRFPIDITAFAERYQLDVFEAYKSLLFIEREGYFSITEDFSPYSKAYVCVRKEDLYKFQVSHPHYDPFIKTLLRSYGGLFDSFVKIKERVLAKNLRMPEVKVKEYLRKLCEMDIIEYEERSSLPVLSFNQPRVDISSLIFSKENYHLLKKNALHKLEAVLDYTANSTICRSQVLLKYFGEESNQRCEICDICLLHKKNKALDNGGFEAITDVIRTTLLERPLSIEKLHEELGSFKKDDIITTLEFLLDQQKVLLKSQVLYWNKK